MERPVTDCTDCPFVEKEDWGNDDGDFGTDYNDCTLGRPAGMSVLEVRKQLAVWEDPPAWCKLRAGGVTVELIIKKLDGE